jgi:hypothetical protein
LVLLALVAWSPHAHAAWIPNGTQVVPWDGIDPSLLPDGAGGAFLAWNPQAQIRLVRIGSDGTVPPGVPGGGTPVYASPYWQYYPILVPDDAGGTYVVWSDMRWAQCQEKCIGTELEIFVVRLLADGSLAPGWPAGGVNVGAPPLPWYIGPSASSDGAGGVIIAWSESSPTDAGNIRARRYAPDGNSVWGNTPITVCSQAAAQIAPRPAPDGAGGAIIVWQDGRVGAGKHALFAQHVTAAGNAAWTPQGVQLGTTSGLDASPASLVAGAGGSVYAAWTEAGGSARIGHLTSLGDMDWVVDLGSPDAINDLHIATDGAVGVLGAWSEDQGNGRDVHLLHLAPDGAPPPGWTGPEIVCDAPGPQSSPCPAHDAAGGAYLLWRDDRSGGIEVFATHVDATGSPAPGWPVNGAVVCSAPGTRTVQGLVPDGQGGALALWDDQRDLPTEVLYAQRLVPGGVLGVPAPHSAAFALLAPWPNPVRDALVAGFVLPDASPARLELIDVTGRRLETRDVGALGAGRHAATFATSAMRPGIYLLRLAGPGGVRSARIAIVR